MSNSGAFVLQEDQPGLRLRLVWKGPRQSFSQHTEEILFDGEAQIISLRTFFFFVPFERRVIPYRMLRKIELIVPEARPGGPLLLRLRLRYQTPNQLEREEEVACRVGQLDRVEEARDLLFRIARTTEQRIQGNAFRASANLEWGYFLEEKGAAESRLTLLQGEQPFAKKVPWIEATADYSEPASPAPKSPPEKAPTRKEEAPSPPIKEEAPQVSLEDLYQRGFVNLARTAMAWLLLLLGPWLLFVWGARFYSTLEQAQVSAITSVVASLLFSLLFLWKRRLDKKARLLLQRGFFRWRVPYQDFFVGPEGVLVLPGRLHPMQPIRSYIVLPGSLTIRHQSGTTKRGRPTVSSETFPLPKEIEGKMRELVSAPLSAPKKGWLLEHLPFLPKPPLAPLSNRVAAFVFTWPFLVAVFLLTLVVPFLLPKERAVFQGELGLSNATLTGYSPTGPFRVYQLGTSLPIELSDFEDRIWVHLKGTPQGTLCLGASLTNERFQDEKRYEWTMFGGADFGPTGRPKDVYYFFESLPGGSYTLRFSEILWDQEGALPPVEIEVTAKRILEPISFAYGFGGAQALFWFFLFYARGNLRKEKNQLIGPGHFWWFLFAGLMTFLFVLRLFGIDPLQDFSSRRWHSSAAETSPCLKNPKPK